MSKKAKASPARGRVIRFAALLAVFSVYFTILGLFSTEPLLSISIDFFVLGLLSLIFGGFMIFVRREFRTYTVAIFTLMMFILFLVTITNFTFQLFFLFLLIADMVYLIYYMGAYTVKIGQLSEGGLTSEEYIPSINVGTKGKVGQETGFLRKDYNKSKGGDV